MVAVRMVADHGPYKAGRWYLLPAPTAHALIAAQVATIDIQRTPGPMEYR